MIEIKTWSETERGGAAFIRKKVRYALCGALTLAVIVLSGVYYRYQNPPEVVYYWPDSLEEMDGENVSQIFHMIHAAEIAGSFDLDLAQYRIIGRDSVEDVAPMFTVHQAYPDLEHMYVPVVLASKEENGQIVILIQDRHGINYCFELEKNDAELYGYKVEKVRRTFGRHMQAVFKGKYV